jgi:hypothetical protein
MPFLGYQHARRRATPLSQTGPEQSSERFAARATPAELIVGDVGEPLGQHAPLATAREAGHLTESSGVVQPAESITSRSVVAPSPNDRETTELGAALPRRPP